MQRVDNNQWTAGFSLCVWSSLMCAFGCGWDGSCARQHSTEVCIVAPEGDCGEGAGSSNFAARPPFPVQGMTIATESLDIAIVNLMAKIQPGPKFITLLLTNEHTAPNYHGSPGADWTPR